MGHFFNKCVKQYSKYLLEIWLFSMNIFEFARVFALPGKAVRIEIRTAPTNISTTRSSVVSPERSPERARGEANGERNRWHPVKCTRNTHHSKCLHSARELVQIRLHRETCSPDSDGGGDSLSGRTWEETEAGGSVFSNVTSSDVFNTLSFPVFKVWDWISLNECVIILYRNYCTFFFLVLSWLYLPCSAGCKCDS